MAPGGGTERWGFDDDGRLRTRTEVWGSSTVHDDAWWYDGRGSATRIQARSNSGYLEPMNYTYDGLGHLIQESGTADGKSVYQQYEPDAFGNRYLTRSYPAARDTLVHGISYRGVAGWRHPYSRLDGEGRMDEAYYNYDAHGNQTFFSQDKGGPSSWFLTRSASYYDAANKLRAVFRRGCTWVPQGSGTTGGELGGGIDSGWTYWDNGAGECRYEVPLQPEQYGGAEEYRYDALGRRIAVRFIPDESCGTFCGNRGLNTLTYTVWDGDRMLYEVRMGSGVAEVGDLQATGGYSDAFGRVFYTHGGALDAPLDIVRAGQAGGPAVVIVRRNGRGQADGGTWVYGSGVSVNWPGSWLTAFRNSKWSYPPAGGWAGSLANEMHDMSGLQYRRNRYYDASSGQFTQSDPIGLAGGINTYGYANGDPVGYSDPYGLCPYEGGKGERNTITKDCPDTPVGDAVRAIGQYGGKDGARTIKGIRDLRLNPVQVGASDLSSRCGDDAGACQAGSDLILPDVTNVANLAYYIVHEVGHAAIPDTRPWAEQYRYEEPLVTSWGLNVWGGLPQRLKPAVGGFEAPYQFYHNNPSAWWSAMDVTACRAIANRHGSC
jgi:RHS repeat-associated protein